MHFKTISAQVTATRDGTTINPLYFQYNHTNDITDRLSNSTTLVTGGTNSTSHHLQFELSEPEIYGYLPSSSESLQSLLSRIFSLLGDNRRHNQDLVYLPVIMLNDERISVAVSQRLSGYVALRSSFRSI